MPMSIVIDGIALLVLIVCAVAAAKKGFVNCVFGLLSLVVAIVVAFILMKPVVAMTGGFFGLEQEVTAGATEILMDIEVFAVDFSATGIREQLAGQLPEFLIDIVVENVADQNIPEGTTLASVVGETLGPLSAMLAAWVSLFIIAKLLLGLLRKIINALVENMPLVGAANALLGLAVGIIEGLFVISAVVSLMAMIPTETVVAAFNQTVFVKMLYNQNPITLLLGLFF